MNLETVLYEVKENIATITMNRPDKRNALNHALLRDLDAAFDQAENDPEVRVVILKGAGKAFCSGYDLTGSPYISIPEGYDRWTIGNALKTLRGISARYLRIFNFPKPTIAQVHGYCLAAGCYLQMCCDVAIAAEDAILGHPATRGGGVTSMPLWVTILGLRKAKELLFTSRLISGKEAERIGLVNKAVPPDKLEEEVWKMAKEMAEVPADGMMILKEALNTHALMAWNLDATFAYHRQLNALGRLGRSEGAAPYTLDQLRSRTRGEKPEQ
jgi:enoyl-CoA hydratase